MIDEFRINTLERGLPNTRWNFSINHRADRWSLMGRLNYFGAFWDSEDGRNASDLPGGPALSWLYPAYSGKALLDLELGIPFGENVTLAIGAENLLNTYPDVNNVWRLHGRQSVRPVLAIRLQRRLLLHPAQLFLLSEDPV